MRLHEFIIAIVSVYLDVIEGNKITINLDSIEAVQARRRENGEILPYSTILTKGGNYIDVTASYDDIIALWKGEKK